MRAEWEKCKSEWLHRLGRHSYKLNGVGATADRPFDRLSVLNEKQTYVVTGEGNNLVAPPSTAMTILTEDMVGCSDDCLKEHFAVYAAANGAALSGRMTTIARNLSELPVSSLTGDALPHSSGNRWTTADAIGYKNCMSLLSHMTHEGESKGAAACCEIGLSNSVEAEGESMTAEGSQRVGDRRLSLLVGSSRYFDSIYWSYQQNTVNTALGTNGRMLSGAPGHNHRRILLTFLQFIRQSKGFSPSLGRTTTMCSTMAGEDPALASHIPMWMFVFYCLRSGNVPVALAELKTQQSRVTGIEGKVLAGVHRALEVWQALAHPKEDTYLAYCRSMAECSLLYKALMREEHADAYLLQLLRLFSGQDNAVATDSEVCQQINFTNTIEDYLWTMLWFVSHAHRLQKCTQWISSPSYQLEELKGLSLPDVVRTQKTRIPCSY